MWQGAPRKLIEYRTHYRWSVIVVTVLTLVLFFRFFQLQILGSTEQRSEKVSYRHASIRIPARRGRILDSNGVVLAHNVEAHDLVIAPMLLKHPEATAALLRQLLKLTDDEYAHLRQLIDSAMDDPRRYAQVVVRRDLVSGHCPFDSAALKPVRPRHKTLWCANCGRTFTAITVDAVRCPHEPARKLDWNDAHTGAVCGREPVEYAATSACPHDGQPLQERTFTLRCPEDGRYFNNEVAVIEANKERMPGVDVETSLRRVYPERYLCSHLTGYMNEVSRKDLDAWPDVYHPGDRIGRAGIERTLEEELRGRWGRRNLVIDRSSSRGRQVEWPDPERPDEDARHGLTVRLTIDTALQRIVRRALRYQRSGAAVLLDANRGDVLAMYSRPSFDPNQWSGRVPADVWRAAISNPYTPLINKALTGYAPGSVYKLVTATAGLHQKAVKPSTEIDCRGAYEFHAHRFRCHNRSGHGPMDLVHSMSRSCDIYYYRVGEMVGMDTLHYYGTEFFGFGRPTGIELAESAGLVPNKAWYQRKNRRWMPGFTLSTAVGQKDIRAFAAAANGGKLMETHIVKHFEDEHGTIVRTVEPKVIARIPLEDDELRRIQEGFWRAVNDEHGTAFSARLDGIEVSGKTGTAEAEENKSGVTEEVARWLKGDHAWFAGYAPSRSPEVVVVVFLDHGGGGGKDAAPVAMRILKEYFAARRVSTAPRAPGPLPNPVRTGPTPSPDRPRGPAVNTTPIDL